MLSIAINQHKNLWKYARATAFDQLRSDFCAHSKRRLRAPAVVFWNKKRAHEPTVIMIEQHTEKMFLRMRK